MLTQFIQQGEQIDITPVSAVAAGAVVFLGTTVCGHAPRAIAAGELGSIQVEGVIRVPKASATEFDAGAVVYWNAGTSLAVTSDASPRMGVAVAGGADGQTFVDVLLNA